MVDAKNTSCGRALGTFAGTSRQPQIRILHNVAIIKEVRFSAFSCHIG